MSIKSYDWYPLATYWNMSFIIRRTSQKDSNKIPPSRGLGHRQCLIIDHATHSGLFYVLKTNSSIYPWHSYGVIQPQKAKGWKCRTITTSSFLRDSPLWAREEDLVWREWGVEEGGGGRQGLTSPTQTIGTFPQAGALQVGYTTFLCISTRHRFGDTVVLKWILCICHQCRNTDLRAIFKICQNLQL